MLSTVHARNDGSPMSKPVSLLTLQFLAWLADRPRTYADVMEAWRSNCPRDPVWEDATLAGLIRFEDGSRGHVILTPRGRAALEEQDARGQDDAAEQPKARAIPLASSR
jgi:hypothetical protein